MQALRFLTGGFFQVNRACLSALIDSKSGNHQVSSQTAAQLLGALLPQLDALEANSHVNNSALEELSSLTEIYTEDVSRFFKILRDGNESEAKEFRLNQLRPKIERINELLGQIASDSNTDLFDQIQKLNKDSSKAGILGLFISFWPFVVITVAILWTALISLKFLSSTDTTSELPFGN